jgi:alkyl hydroperoxide reductase subunit AhpC
MIMTFEQAMKVAEDLNIVCSKAGEELNKFPKLANGLTPDDVKASKEWQQAKAHFDFTFKMLQNINQEIGRKYKKERAAYYQAIREARIKNNP